MLTPGTPFPDLELTCVDGTRLRLPDGLGTGWSVVLFFRGHF